MPDASIKPKNISQENFDVVSNQIGLIFAQRESLIKSWAASSLYSMPPVKTLEELDAEDAALFQSQPLHLGLGASIPSQFKLSEIDRNNNFLRAKLSGSRSIRPKKSKDADEKTIKLKRLPKDESSDEELGRSSLGKAKRPKQTKISEDFTQFNNFAVEIVEKPCNKQVKDSKSHSQIDSNNLPSTTKPEIKNDGTEYLRFNTSGHESLKKSNQVDELETNERPESNADGYKNPKAPNVKIEVLPLMDREAKKRLRKREKKKRQKLRNKSSHIS
ncbi:hypothetical protein OnM2_102022 [Erysiphe neolycopersici]|uniref:Uncharacterized protein n=1 Tax=Erysiphe neolycopersici TaxID=212602 RepID=A0A420H8K5_9PEZI|nr:hypothetical protein OnM2_102022 [Erysiphe neolycopersici]